MPEKQGKQVEEIGNPADGAGMVVPMDCGDEVFRPLRAGRVAEAGDKPIPGEAELLLVVERGKVEECGDLQVNRSRFDISAAEGHPFAFGDPGSDKLLPHPLRKLGSQLLRWIPLDDTLALHHSLLVPHNPRGNQPPGQGILLEPFPNRIADGDPALRIANFIEAIDEEEGPVRGEEGAERRLVSREGGSEGSAPAAMPPLAEGIHQCVPVPIL